MIAGTVVRDGSQESQGEWKSEMGSEDWWSRLKSRVAGEQLQMICEGEITVVACSRSGGYERSTGKRYKCYWNAQENTTLGVNSRMSSKNTTARTHFIYFLPDPFVPAPMLC